DTNDAVLFRLIHNTSMHGTGRKWTVQLPDGTDYKSVGSSDSSKSYSWKSGIDLNIENLAGDGKPITLKIRQPKGHLDPSYHVLVDGQLVARVTKEKPGSRSIFPSWEVEIAKGFDLALVWICHRQDTGLAPIDQAFWGWNSEFS
ncbi:unnamed protein product, partial [Aureobasidium mustum]